MAKMRSIWQLLAILTLIGCSGSRSGRPAEKPGVELAKQLGLGDYQFYKSTSKTQSAFFSKQDLDNVFQVLGTEQKGELRQLTYSRKTKFDQGSPFLKLNEMRAKTYNDARQMLQDLGITTPIMLSASLIDGYLKYHNDRWYSALEHALSQKIPNTNISRFELAAKLRTAMNDGDVRASEIDRILKSASDLEGASLAKFKELWLADPFQYKPISFYSESEELQRLWTIDRILLANIKGSDRDEIDSFNQWFAGEENEAKAALLELRKVFAHVTNRVDAELFSDGGISELINRNRNDYECDGRACGHLWAPSSPGILERLSAEERAVFDKEAKSQPDMQKLIDLTRSGKISLKPKEDEGFFIYQRYALESLLNFKKLPEAAIVKPDEKVLEMWEEAFKAGTAKALETHQKVIDTGGAVKATSETFIPALENLILEPIPSLYLRYAKQYQFLKTYAQTLPADFVNLWKIDGVPIVDFASKLERQMVALYVLSTEQLRMTISDENSAYIDALGGSSDLLAHARSFVENIHKDVALAEDQRFMAVQGRPGGPKKSNCLKKPATFWSTIGIEAVPVSLHGSIDVEDVRSRRSFQREAIVLLDHFAEVNACVREPLTRGEWRQLLDSSKNTEEAAKKLLDQF